MMNSEDYTATSPPIARSAGGAYQSTKAERRMKAFLIVWNILLFIFSCVLMAYGSYALSTNLKGQVGSVARTTLPAGVVTLGVFLFFLSFLGCISTWKELNIGLALYFIILFIMVVLLLGVGGAVLAKKKDARNMISDGWQDASTDLKCEVQQYFRCCGLNEPNNFDVPTCCADPNNAAIKYPTGCIDPMVDTFNARFEQAGGAALAFAIIMLVGLVIIIILMQRIKSKSDRLRYGPTSENVRSEEINPDAEANF
jgi:preprotein translocase subunit SecG